VPLQINLPDQAVAVALITGCTTVAVACVKAAAEVTIAWIQASHPRQPSSAREVEPPDP
jgi:hypothetical protein